MYAWFTVDTFDGIVTEFFYFKFEGRKSIFKINLRITNCHREN